MLCHNMEHIILCGGIIGFQDGCQLNSDYNNDYLIMRHICKNNISISVCINVSVSDRHQPC